MTREKLKQYRALRREIALLDKALDRLKERAAEVPEVMGKVTGSSRDFPYIKRHFSVQMDEPIQMDGISRRIRIKEKRRKEAEKLAAEIEQFIAGIPDSVDRQIFEMIYLEGKKQREAAEAVGYSRSRVTQKISQYLKD